MNDVLLVVKDGFLKKHQNADTHFIEITENPIYCCNIIYNNQNHIIINNNDTIIIIIIIDVT